MKILKNQEKSITRKIWRKKIMPWNLVDRNIFYSNKINLQDIFLKISIGYKGWAKKTD